jgi:invasion protein IalB
MARSALRIVFAGAIAALVVGGAYVMAGAPGLRQAQAFFHGKPATPPGFTGTTAFEKWKLICAAEPQSEAVAGAVSAPDPATPEPAAPATHLVTTCRINQEVASKDRPDEVIMAVNFSVVGAAQRPALMLRLPSTAKANSAIALRIDDNSMTIPVRNCTDKECIAASELSDETWNRLLRASLLEISIPAAGGQFVLLDLSLKGFADAVDALTAAQTKNS